MSSTLKARPTARAIEGQATGQERRIAHHSVDGREAFVDPDLPGERGLRNFETVAREVKLEGARTARPTHPEGMHPERDPR